jgi:hypothetical protein
MAGGAEGDSLHGIVGIGTDGVVVGDEAGHVDEGVRRGKRAGLVDGGCLRHVRNTSMLVAYAV